MKNQKNSKGFTLVEVLIAVSILAIAVIPLLANFVTSSRVNVKSKRTLNATTVAQNIMEGISAFGVESAIVQLEDQTASPVKLRFMPEGMNVGNWGRAKFLTTTSPVLDPTTGMPMVDLNTGATITVETPQYYEDRYQDDDNTDEIAMDAKESTMFSDELHSTVTSAMKYAYVKEERDGTKKVYFKENASHAYMFWMENVSYGNQKYDILLTMDANTYRKDGEDLFDTTQDVSHRSRAEIKSKMSDSADPDGFGKNRNYNSLNLSKITTSIGTNVASDDDVEDRYYTEPTNALSEAVLEIKDNCVLGVTSEMIQERIERTINIEICKEANPLDSSKPFWVINIEYVYHLTDTGLLKPDSEAADAIVKKEAVVYRSSEYPPRNLFFYYFPNYAPTDAGGSVADRINIINKGGAEISGGSGSLGTDVNVYLVRMCDANVFDPSGGPDEVSLGNSESRYRVDINLEEETVSGGIHTSIYTNTGYNLRDDSEVSSMGEYYRNGMYVDRPEKIGVRNLSGTYDSPDIMAINGEDYIYRVTVQVFRAGSGFQKASRIAKFSGSSN